MKDSSPDVRSVAAEYGKALAFNDAIRLNDTVRTNENFFIGKQWEGVRSNGLPTPVFNFLKRVVLFSVASVTSDELKLLASAPDGGSASELCAQLTSAEFEALFERVDLGGLLRRFARNAAVDGDACMFTFWDASAPNSNGTSGAIATEIVENNRVFFGNPCDRRVQTQPYILVSRRELLPDVQRRAERFGGQARDIVCDCDDRDIDEVKRQGDRATVLLRLWKSRETGTVHAMECTRTALVRPEWDTGLKLYPLVWMNWDFVQDSYHGQALITGLIPNQIFINKLFAMSMISLMTTAYPKIVYDKTRIQKWDNRVGAAIGVCGGDMGSVARIINPAQISPQIAQFIQLAVEYTQTFLGATPAALGDVKPDNTSAILALQRASAVPSELTRRELYRCVEELGRIYMDFMCSRYGERCVRLPAGEGERIWYNFDALRGEALNLRLDVGASAYWSEIASMQTLDNLLAGNKISLLDYLERIPEGYVARRSELVEKLRRQEAGETDAGTGI